MGMQGMFGDRLFSIFDKDGDDLLNKEEFVSGISRLFTTEFNKNVRIVFDLFDFDNDGFITAEDMRVLLSHLPIQSSNTEIITSKGSAKTQMRSAMYFL